MMNFLMSKKAKSADSIIEIALSVDTEIDAGSDETLHTRSRSLTRSRNIDVQKVRDMDWKRVYTVVVLGLPPGTLDERASSSDNVTER